MATPRDGRRKRIEVVNMLAECGLNDPEIAQTLGVSLDTVKTDRYVPKINKKAPYHHPKAHFSHLVSTYAELIVGGHISEHKELNSDAVSILERGLETALRIPEILAALKGAQAAVSAPITKDPRAENYHKLLVAIFGRNANQSTGKEPDDFFHQYIMGVYRGEFPLPDSFEMLRDRLLVAYLEEELTETKPCWTNSITHLVIQILDEIIATFSSKETQILEFRFGLKGEFKTLEQTGKLFGISRERVRNIEGIAIRKLKHASRSSYLRILTKSSAELLEYKLHQALHDIREQKTEKLLEQISHGLVIVNFAPAQLQYLCRSVDEIEIGVRSYNNLKNADIKTIYELVQKNEADMLKSRWFGRKNIQEIKDILAGMGLSLGMHFDEATERAYEALKKR